MPEIKRPLRHKVTKQGNDKYTITHKHSLADIIRHLYAEGCDFPTLVHLWHEVEYSEIDVTDHHNQFALDELIYEDLYGNYLKSLARRKKLSKSEYPVRQR